METRTVQFERQHSGEAPVQQMIGSHPGLGHLSIQTPVITRRAFFAAMIAVLAEEFHEGRCRRNGSSLA